MNTNIADRSKLQTVVVAALCATLIVSFARTFYLRFLFDLPPLSKAAILHGVIATLWVGLHFTQARLIAAHRVALHKKLGIVTAVVGVLLIVQTLDLSVARVAAGHAPNGRNPLEFLSVQVGTVTMFTLFLTSALLLRKKREWHKRLMLLTTMTLLMPAVARIDAITTRPLGMPPLVLPMLVTGAFLLWACVRDVRSRGSVHPALWIGGLALMVSMPAKRFLGFTDAWLPVAHWLVEHLG